MLQVIDVFFCLFMFTLSLTVSWWTKQCATSSIPPRNPKKSFYQSARVTLSSWTPPPEKWVAGGWKSYLFFFLLIACPFWVLFSFPILPLSFFYFYFYFYLFYLFVYCFTAPVICCCCAAAAAASDSTVEGQISYPNKSVIRTPKIQ